MSAIEGLAGPTRLAFIVLCLFLAVSSSSLAQFAEQKADNLPQQLSQFETGVWLVTYGPGEIYWQRFGHNGIWIRDEDLGLDHVFNFGFFDFEQENFFLRFLQGRMLYFSAAQPAQREFAQYIDENRSIRLQKLGLSGEQALRLADYLVREVQVENRDYLYDYYMNNCSTRVRDALDFALDGQLRSQFSTIEANQNFRDHTRRLTATDFWLYLGLELGLGRPVDSDISRWDEFFVPAELADGLTQMQAADGLLQEDVLLYESSAEPPPATSPLRWPFYAFTSLLLLGFIAFLNRGWKQQRNVLWARGWLLFNGVIGSGLLFFWFGTDHAVAAQNFNLLLFNPFFLLVLIPRLLRPVAFLMVAAGVIALLQSLLPAPTGQYSADVVAAILPLNLVAAWVLLRISAADSAVNRTIRPPTARAS